MENSFRLCLYSNVFLDVSYLKSKFSSINNLIFSSYIMENGYFDDELFYEMKNGHLGLFLLDISQNLNEVKNILNLLLSQNYNSKVVVVFIGNEYVLDSKELEFQKHCKENFKVIYLDNQNSVSKLVLNEYKIAKFELKQLINKSLFSSNEKFFLIDEQHKSYPSAIALSEQKIEANNALIIWNLETSLKHLKNALELKPLDFSSNFYIAYVLMTKNSKKLFIKVKEALINCICVAKRDDDLASYAICAALLARAYLMSGKQNECINILSDAKNSDENSALVRYEMAKFLIIKKRFNEAKNELENAFKFDVNTLDLIKEDPFFDDYEELKDDLLQKESIVSNMDEYKFAFEKFESKKELIAPKANFNIENEAKKGIFEQLSFIKESLDEMEFNEANSELKKDEFIKLIYSKSEENIEFENKKKAIKSEHSSNLESSNLKFYNNLLMLKENKKQALKSFFVTIGLIFAILFGLCFLLSQKNGGFHTGLFVSILVIGILSVVIGSSIIRKKYDTQISKNAQNRQDAQDELDDAYKENIKEISTKQDEELKRLYENKINEKLLSIKNSIETFENLSIDNNSAKAIFSNLKTATQGGVIIVDKNDTGYELNEDFPLCLNIPKANGNFLAKVIYKDQNEIKLSRFGAYKD